MLSILQKRASHVDTHNSAFYFDAEFDRLHANRLSFASTLKDTRPRSLSNSISSLWRRRRSSSSDQSIPSLSTSSTASSVMDPEDATKTSAKAREFEELIAAFPERTVKLSITPEWAA